MSDANTHEYKFQTVTGTPFSVTCLGCGLQSIAGDIGDSYRGRPFYADLNGEAFKAYYCRDCAARLS